MRKPVGWEKEETKRSKDERTEKDASAGGRNSPGGAGSQRPREGGSVFPTPPKPWCVVKS